MRWYPLKLLNISFYLKFKQTRQTVHKKTCLPHLLIAFHTVDDLLAMAFVADGQLLATLGAAAGQHAAAVLRGHALAEAMLVHAAAIVRLKCSFHRSIFFVNLLLFDVKSGAKPTFRAAKLHKSFQLRKKYLKFS